MPISDCEVRDPRIKRTRKMLQNALRELMHTKGLDEISVLDITEAATVNRATFYDHYTDKFALIDAMAGGDFHLLLAERNIRFNGTCPSAIVAIILATCDYLIQAHSHRDVCQKQSAFQPLMDAAITSTIGRVLMPGLGKEGGVSESLLPASLIASAASWAIYGAVKQWMETPDRLPAEEIAPLVAQFIFPILEAGNSKAQSLQTDARG